jgi:hypothetical protein
VVVFSYFLFQALKLLSETLRHNGLPQLPGITSSGDSAPRPGAADSSGGFLSGRFRTLIKGPKLEIFGSGVFTQIRPAWVGDLGARPKNLKLGWFRPENCQFVLFSAVGYNATATKQKSQERKGIYYKAPNINFLDFLV